MVSPSFSDYAYSISCNGGAKGPSIQIRHRQVSSLLKKCRCETIVSLGVSISQRIRSAWEQVRKTLVELNLFETAAGLTDRYVLVTERITTRVYLTFLAVSIGILIFYAFIDLRMQSMTVRNPSRDDFNRLYEQYRSKLHCPCSQLTIPYGSFLSISPVFHPACTSWLVSEEWFQYLIMIRRQHHYLRDDFRLNAPSFFITLGSLCKLADRTIVNAWDAASHTVLYADEALPRDYLLADANEILSRFQTSTKQEFKSSFAIISLQTQSILVSEGGSSK